MLRVLALTRLTRHQSEALVQNLTGGLALPDQVMEHILDKTEGVPLFVEELTKEILESGVLSLGEKGYEMESPLAAVEIPRVLAGFPDGAIGPLGACARSCPDRCRDRVGNFRMPCWRACRSSAQTNSTMR